MHVIFFAELYTTVKKENMSVEFLDENSIESNRNKAEHAVQSNAAGKVCIILLGYAEQC